MAQRLRLVAGDTPAISLLVTDADGRPVDISTATVRMYVRVAGASAIKATVVATPLPGRESSTGAVNLAPPYHVAGKGGRAVCVCPSTVFDVAGAYEAEVETTFSDATVRTAYQIIRITVRKDF